MRKVVYWGIAVLMLMVAACAHPPKSSPLATLYDRSAQYHGLDRNPVILIPGILGSGLLDEPSQRVVWGAFSGDYADPSDPDGARLFALPMAEGVPLADLRDSVVANGALDHLKISFLGIPLDVGAYVNILGALGIGGYRDDSLGRAGEVDYGQDHFTCFQFAYDWRRDNVENARLLAEFVADKRRYVQKELQKRYGVANAEVKFDIVAHSMGGLLTRYYLRYGDQDLPADGSTPTVTWAGARDVERVIFVGPPNAGSVDAQMELVQGKSFSVFFPHYDAAVLGTMPSIYQLLPRGRHGFMVDAADSGLVVTNILAPELWQNMAWGLASPEQDKVLVKLLPGVADPRTRRRIAVDHQQKCLRRAGQFFAALDAPASPPPGLDLVLIAGDALQTASQVAVDRTNGRIAVKAWAPGDGTVLRSSALMDERQGRPWTAALQSPIHWEQVIFLFSEHLGLTKDPAFTDNMLYMLLEDPRSIPSAP